MDPNTGYGPVSNPSVVPLNSTMTTVFHHDHHQILYEQWESDLLVPAKKAIPAVT